MKKILDNLPTGPVLFLGTVFALMPVLPEPHLWEKMMMLVNGVTLLAIDWFDICVHGGAALLVVAKLVRMQQVKAESAVRAVSGDEKNSAADRED